MLDEDEAVSCAGELLSFVYGTASERWSKGKGKIANGKDRPSSGKGFGVYGTYAEFKEGSSRCPGPAVAGATTAGNWAIGPKTVLRSVVCRRHQSPRPGGGQQTSGNRSGGLFTNLFFMGAPSPQTDDAGQVVFPFLGTWLC